MTKRRPPLKPSPREQVSPIPRLEPVQEAMAPLPDPVAGVKRISLRASALQQASGPGHRCRQGRRVGGLEGCA